MRLIGLVGKARVGKDTVAEHLASWHSFRTYSFAGPMKEMLEGVFGDKFRGGDREAVIPWLGKSPRHLLQTLGTEWGRELVHQDLWMLLGEQQIAWQRAYRPSEPMVISDVRFHNEADMILRTGGELWHLTRPDSEGVGIDGHASEAADWSGYERRCLYNTGTLSELFQRVDSLMEVPKCRLT
jgi:hypothetical protein